MAMAMIANAKTERDSIFSQTPKQKKIAQQHIT
jgi:hypothetical protein